MLFPAGDIRSCPWYLAHAISHAVTVLGYFELPEDDQPPREIWLDHEALSQHFDEVKGRYKSKGSGSSSSEAVPQVDVPSEHTRALRGA